MLALDGRVGRAAAHGEVVAAHHHGAAVHARAAEDEVGRGQALELIVRVVGRLASDLAHFVESVGVDQARQALPDGQAPLVVLALDPCGPAELLGEGFAPSQLVELRLPVLRHALSSCSVFFVSLSP